MILVTGGAGLLGNALITHLLAANKKVKAIYHKTPLAMRVSDNFTAIKCDLLDVVEVENALHGVTEIYHCAGMVSFSKQDEKLLYKINVEATANLVNAALHAAVRKFVHVSSVAALGRMRPGQFVNEQMQWTPETSNSKYGHSKYLGELEVWRANAEGLNAVIINPAIILGAGNWHEGSTNIFKNIYNGLPWYTEGTTGFVDVKDVSAIMEQLMNSNISAERFIVSAENVSYKSVFSMIAKAFNKKAPSKKVTATLAGIVWRLQAVKAMFTGIKPLITKETAATSLATTTFDNSKLLQFLPGFHYRSLQHTIGETCAALQQKVNNL